VQRGGGLRLASSFVLELLGLGVSLRCAPGRAARAVGNDTAVANGAGPPPRHVPHRSSGIGARAAASRPSGRASLTQGMVAAVVTAG